MYLTQFNHSADFLDRSLHFLTEHEAENNLIIGLTRGLIDNPERYKFPPYHAILERDGQIVATALRTPPHLLILSHFAAEVAEAVLDLLVEDVYELYGKLPGVLGPAPYSLQFAERWQTLTGRPFRQRDTERIFRLSKVKPVTGVAGQMRLATVDDFELVAAWVAAFYAEALDAISEAEARSGAEGWLTLNGRYLYLWETGGEVVSMAGASGRTPHGIRIGAVYTPPEHRRRGYASALVAGVSQTMLDGGCTFCFLFTDLSNPTSNHIYQTIGYEAVCDFEKYLID